jgi:hypothetical protein
MKSYGATLSFALRTRRGNLLKFQENSLLAFADNGDINTTKNVHTRWGPIFRSGLISASPWGKKRTARSNTACAWTHPRARRGPETAHAASLRSSRCAALRERKKNTRLFDAMGVGGRLSGREIAFWERHHWRLAAARWPTTIFERCLSSLDQIYSYKFQKALDSSPKKSLLAAVVVLRKAVPKIRVLVVGLLVGVFVRVPQHPRRRARADSSWGSRWRRYSRAVRRVTQRFWKGEWQVEEISYPENAPERYRYLNCI